MRKKIGLGTLSLSGSYQKKNKNQLEKEIDNIDPTFFDFIDFAYVYKEFGLDILDLMARNSNWKKKILTSKLVGIYQKEI